MVAEAEPVLSFTAPTGREWSLRLDALSRARLEDLLGCTVAQFFGAAAGDVTTFMQLATDPRLLIRAVAAVVKSDARMRPAVEAYLAGTMRARHIDAAGRAIVRAMIECFPDHEARREFRRQVGAVERSRAYVFARFGVAADASVEEWAGAGKRFAEMLMDLRRRRAAGLTAA